MDNNINRNPFAFANGNVLKSVLSEAYTELRGGSAWGAVSKYKSALDMVSLESGYPYPLSAPSDSNQLIIRYALCWALIHCGDYPHLAKAVEQLEELIQIGHDKTLPALYYALAKAYRLLFRFNNANDLLAKGKKVLSRVDQLREFYWPGTPILIPETVRQNLEASMELLKRECGSYHSPDARCKYEKCLKISEHIVPSENIYFADPKFAPFLVLTCQEKCKVEFHVACWKDMKKESNGIEKPKDMLGQPCPTIDCVSSTKERSVVVEVRLVDKGDVEGSTKVWILPNVPVKKPATNAKKKTKADKPTDNKFDEKLITSMLIKTKKKEKKNPLELSPPGAPGQDLFSGSSKPFSTSNEPSFEEQLIPKVGLLEKLRKINFGFKSTDIMNPEEKFFGNPQVKDLARRGVFLESFSSHDKEKEFILSMFYDFLKKEGVQDIKDINAAKDKMLDKSDEIDANGITDIWQLLLESRRFCAIGDKIGTSEDLPSIYKDAEAEIIESTSQVVLGSVMKGRNSNARFNQEEANIANPFLLFPPMHTGSRPEMPLINSDTVMNNFANDHSSPWGIQPGFKHLRQPPQGDLGSSDLSSVSNDKMSSPDNEPRDYSAFTVDNILNANLAIKSIGPRNEHKNSIHSIGAEDALNDNLDMRRNENFAPGSSFDHPPPGINPLKNGVSVVEDSIGGIPFSDKIDLSDICTFYMGPRWINEDQKSKDREIKELKEALKHFCHMEENFLRAQLELTQSLEKKQTEIEGLKLTIKKFESLLDEKNKHLEESSKRIRNTEQEILQADMRLLEQWKQHEDFIIKTINQKSNERLTVVNHLKKFMSESDRKKINDEMRIFESARSFNEITRRIEDFYNSAKERVRLGIRNYYLPEHTVDPNVGANVIEQALECIGQGAKTSEPSDRPISTPFDGFFQHQPSTSFQTPAFVRPIAPPLMSIPVPRPPLVDPPPSLMQPTPAPSLPGRSQSTLSQSSSRSSTPQPAGNEPAASVSGTRPSTSDSSSTASAAAAAAQSAAQTAKAAASAAKAAAAAAAATPTAAAIAAVAGTKSKATPVPPLLLAKVLPPSKLPSSDKASVPFPIEPIRPKFSNFSTLTEEMSFLFPAASRQDLVKAMKQIKNGRPNKTLNGMSQQTIADKVEALLASKDFKRPSPVGLEKFSSAAWGAAPNTSNNWKGSDENECQICQEPMLEKYFLICKHAFHESCINEWGKRNAECPLCRQYFKTDKNYPELPSAAN